MGTRSLIGIQGKDGSVDYIYSHWDGYLTGVGQTLFNFFTDRKKVRRLVNHGDASSIEKNIGRKHPMYSRNPIHQEVCTFYRRDRGDKNVSFKTTPSLKKFKDKDFGAQFWYVRLYKGGWAYSDNLKRDFHVLTPQHFVKKV